MALIPVIQAGDAQYLYGEVMNTGDVDSDEVNSLPGGGGGGGVQYFSMALIPVIQAGDAQYLYGEVMNTGDVDSDEVSSVIRLSCCIKNSTIWALHPAKTQVSLGIGTVLSESSLCA